MMPIDAISDWETRIARQDAFWQRQILDRPVVCITLPKPTPVGPLKLGTRLKLGTDYEISQHLFKIP